MDPRLNEYEIDEIVSRHTDSAVRTSTGPGGEPVSSRDFQRILELGMNAWIDAGDGDDDHDGVETATAGLCRDVAGVRARCRAGLSAAATGLTSGSTAVVFTSGGVIAALCCSLLGLGPKTVIAFNRVAVNGGMTKVASGRSGLSLVSFNEHGYLEGAGPGLVTLR